MLLADVCPRGHEGAHDVGGTGGAAELSQLEAQDPPETFLGERSCPVIQPERSGIRPPVQQNGTRLVQILSHDPRGFTNEQAPHRRSRLADARRNKHGQPVRVRSGQNVLDPQTHNLMATRRQFETAGDDGGVAIADGAVDIVIVAIRQGESQIGGDLLVDRPWKDTRGVIAPAGLAAHVFVSMLQPWRLKVENAPGDHMIGPTEDDPCHRSGPEDIAGENVGHDVLRKKVWYPDRNGRHSFPDDRDQSKGLMEIETCGGRLPQTGGARSSLIAWLAGMIGAQEDFRAFVPPDRGHLRRQMGNGLLFFLAVTAVRVACGDVTRHGRAPPQEGRDTDGALRSASP